MWSTTMRLWIRTSKTDGAVEEGRGGGLRPKILASRVFQVVSNSLCKCERDGFHSSGFHAKLTQNGMRDFRRLLGGQHETQCSIYSFSVRPRQRCKNQRYLSDFCTDTNGLFRYIVTPMLFGYNNVSNLGQRARLIM